MRHIVLLVMLVFFLGLTAEAQSKKEQISTLQLQIDSVNNVLTVTRGQLEKSQQQFKETDELAKRLDAQLVLSKKDLQFTGDSLRASSNENKALKITLDLNKKELETLAEKNERLKSELSLVRDSLVRVAASFSRFQDSLSILNTSHILFFSDGYGKYQLTIKGSDIKIDYQYAEYVAIDPEHAILQENKIIVPKNRVDGLEGLGRDAVYKIINNQLCVYNPENDLDDCYQFMREKSTSDLKNFFK
jgi:hypothetical protein